MSRHLPCTTEHVITLAMCIKIMTSVAVTGTLVDEREEYMRNLFRNYDSLQPPYLFQDGPTIVTTQVLVEALDSVSEGTMDFKTTIYLRQKWTDTRLKFDTKKMKGDTFNVDSRARGKVWVPDMYINNEKESKHHSVTVPNQLIRVHYDGTILFSLRISIKASCPMALNVYPHDNQICYLGFESFGYTHEQVELRWKDTGALGFLHQVHLSQFALHTFNTSQTIKEYETGNFTLLEARFFLRREIEYYLLHVYVPSVLIVVLSWVNFWIDMEAVPARITVGMLTVLTMTTQSGAVRQYMPKVSYVQALDVWMSVCLIMVVLGLLEYAVVNVVYRKQRRLERTKSKDDIEKTEYSENTPPGGQGGSDEENSCKAWYQDLYIKHGGHVVIKARKVDKLSRILFPTAFLLFNFIYWPLYIL